MPSIAEIIAAKKAAVAQKLPAPTLVEATEQKVAAQEITPVEATKTISTPVKEEVAAVQVEKPMTFAERMAQRKALATAATTVSQQTTLAATPVATTTQTPVSELTASVGTESPKVETNQNIQPALVVGALEEQAAPIPALEDTTTETLETIAKTIPDGTDPTIAQAYTDIKIRIDRLAALSDTDLEPQMKELKKALMSNPAATELMHETDIGRMVVALRRLTKEAIVEAATEKKPGRKAKDKPMLVDADAIAAVFDEL